MTNTRLFLYGMNLAEAEALALKYDMPKYRGMQILEWLYKTHISSIDQATNLPDAFRKKLSEDYALHSLKQDEIYGSGMGESDKYLFRTHDGHLLESVLISQRGRSTVCVSTQLGCKIGCTFCASGKGAFGRNLSAGEIIEQMIWIERGIKKPVTNIVFMGMGEPFDNFEATLKTIEILRENWGMNMAPRRITVSTSGITPRITEFVDRTGGQVRLSISLHSSQEAKRDELVPINRKYRLTELVATLKHLKMNIRRRLTFEYTLIKGQNDSKEEADGVAKIARPLDALVNVIPYNPIREMDYETPLAADVDKFRERLVSQGVRVMVRDTAGQDINAACGQLRLNREKV